MNQLKKGLRRWWLWACLVVALLLLALLLGGCEPITPTPGEATSTPGEVTVYPVTETPTPSLTPSPTATFTPTVTPNLTTTPVAQVNLLANPGMEGSYRAVIFGEVNVAPEWEPFYCDEPYTGEQCPAPRQGTGNPVGLMMGRPEFKPIDAITFSYRVHSGDLAQLLFCFYRTCDAGVFQTFATNPGETYEVGAYVQAWQNNDDDLESDLVTPDDWAGTQWYIKIDTNSDQGIKSAFDSSLAVCRFNNDATTPADQVFYDQYVPISCRFVAQGETATVFIGNKRLWPVINNDAIIDDAWAYQVTGDTLPEEPEHTPTPIVPSTPVPTATPRPVSQRELDPAVKYIGAVYEPFSSQWTRDDHRLAGLAIGGLLPGQPVAADWRWQDVDGITTWLCIDDQAEVIPHPTYDWLNILSCGEWAAYNIKGTVYGKLLPD